MKEGIVLSNNFIKTTTGAIKAAKELYDELCRSHVTTATPDLERKAAKFRDAYEKLKTCLEREES